MRGGRGSQTRAPGSFVTNFELAIMIKFGTSGWRGLIARDFTFDNVRLASQGIADYLLAHVPASNSKVVILGHDTRFLGREFSLAAAEVLISNGLAPLL